MHKCNFVEDVLKLGWGHNDSFLKYYGSFMPFINEIFNLLTITVTKRYFNIALYPHHPVTYNEALKKLIVDTLAVTGIVTQGVLYTSSHGTDVGLLKGILYTIFTFFIPNLFMDSILSVFKNNIVQLAIGFIVIYMLDFIVNFISCKYINHKLAQQKEH